MAAPNAASIPASPTDPREPAHLFFDRTPLKSVFEIPEDALDAVMATAYQLYQAGRYPEVEILCRGLIAADHTYWWSYSLYAATLRRLGRLDEALVEIEKGLAHEPASAKLLFMRDELRQLLAGRRQAPTHDANANPDRQAAA